MEQKIRALREAMEQRISEINSKETLAAFWQDFLGKKGSIADLMKGLGAVAKEDRPAMGKVINDFKIEAEEKYKALSEKMEQAEYFGIDATIVRLAWVLFSLCGGCGVLAYIIALIIMPSKPE